MIFVTVDRVLTITNWYDGPVEGVAYYSNECVIYERVFSEETDDYSGNYYLTPISPEKLELIMDFWEKWVEYVDGGYKGDFSCKNPIRSILDNSKDFHKYIKKGKFHISDYGNIKCEKWVEWN